MAENPMHTLYKQTLLSELTKMNFSQTYPNSELIKQLYSQGKHNEAKLERERLWDEAKTKALEHPYLKDSQP